MRDSMWKGHGGFEIALSPVLFGAFGWFVDGRLGISPVATIVFAVIGLFGSVVNQYVRYTAAMERATNERLATRPKQATVDPASAKRFGPVEPEQPRSTVVFVDDQCCQVSS